jgi:hypothetical protein
MIAVSPFAAADLGVAEHAGQLQHPVVLYGVANQGHTVLLNDPWQPSTRRMFVDEFAGKLHMGHSRPIASSKFISMGNQQTVPQNAH